MMYEVQLANEEATQTWASRFAACIEPNLVLTFIGPIGAGKTTFIRALLRQLGVTGAIKSPTFSLIESYNCEDLFIHHFDLYRIVDDSELEYLGFRDYFSEKSLCCIEWPDRIKNRVIESDLSFSFTVLRKGRLMTLIAHSVLGEKILACMAVKQ